MNESVLIVIAVMLFFFTFELRPKIVKKYPDAALQIDVIMMAITITTILVPTISLITTGAIPVASYFILLPIFTGYMLHYGIKHRNELKDKTRRVFISLIFLYIYVFCASGIMMFWAAPFIPNAIL